MLAARAVTGLQNIERAPYSRETASWDNWIEDRTLQITGLGLCILSIQ